ncbi:hypothetical protein Tco_1206401, partial [Tanacetum coccineum]
IFRGKVFVLRAKEIPGWVPEFADEFDDDDESEEGSKGDTATSHGAFNFRTKRESIGRSFWHILYPQQK